MSLIDRLTRISVLAQKGSSITVEEVRELMTLITRVFREHLISNNFNERQITRLTTKLRDAGRRSPPWKPTSSRVPGRPQDGSDGNRISRWLMKPDNKFYADEITATLVEIKYYLQLFSMQDAPPLPENTLSDSFNWLIDHEVKPNSYVDPIQKIPISLKEVLDDARIIQSGHLHPLDRGGKHEPSNTFLMLKGSNNLQGNLTLEELLTLMAAILERHKKKVS